MSQARKLRLGMGMRMSANHGRVTPSFLATNFNKIVHCTHSGYQKKKKTQKKANKKHRKNNQIRGSNSANIVSVGQSIGGRKLKGVGNSRLHRWHLKSNSFFYALKKAKQGRKHNENGLNCLGRKGMGILRLEILKNSKG